MDQEKIFDADKLQLIHPFRMILGGASGSGKSYIAFKIIRYRRLMINSAGRELNVYIYLPQDHSIEFPDFIRNDPQIHIGTGLPKFESLPHDSLVFIDDQMEHLDESVQMAWTKFSHHRRLSLMLNVQNIFYATKRGILRNISLNSTHIILTNNKRDRKQVAVLASQLSPKNSEFIIHAYNDATKLPFSYILFDLSQEQDDFLRYRTSIFPDDEFTVIYVEK